jgi:tRNA pseudouridine55 synthase
VGIHAIHKPHGVSSHARLRAFLGLPDGVAAPPVPACHGGTLDPFAEGLLLVLVGGATRVMERLHALPKTYVAEVVWGVETDTGDGGGIVVRRAPPPAPDVVRAALGAFLGWRDQVPPATSARRVDGERAYVRAHRGEDVVMAPRPAYLHALSVDPAGRLVLTCRGGYYVRSLVRDLGRAVGSAAHVRTLRRTAIGPWTDPGPRGAPVRACGAGLLPWCATRALDDGEAHRVRLGGVVPVGALRGPAWPWPSGFPPPDGAGALRGRPEAPPQEEVAAVLGVHRERAVALLAREGDRLRPLCTLRGGA